MKPEECLIIIRDDSAEFQRNGEWVIIKPVRSREEAREWAARWYPGVKVIEQ